MDGIHGEMKYKKRGGNVDIKIKLLASKFKNISYFQDIEDYISDRINEKKFRKTF